MRAYEKENDVVFAQLQSIVYEFLMEFGAIFPPSARKVLHVDQGICYVQKIFI